MNLQAISQLAELCDYSFAFALRAVAAIGVADHLADGPLHINELAERTQCNAHGLVRALRMLAMKSVFVEEPADIFALAPAGELLRTDHPLSMRWFFRLEPDVHALAALDYSVRTGQPAFEHVFGSDYFAWLASSDEHRRRFRKSQRALDRLELIAIEREFRWQDATSFVDVGGADGTLVATLLRRFPALTGAVFDLPEATADADEIFREAGVTGRSSVIRGDVLRDEVPAGADVYVIKRILGGFSDETAILALAAVRRAMAGHSRLLIVEPLRNAPDRVGVSPDLQMLALGLGRVRAADELARLLIAAGLRTTATRPAGVVAIIEAEVAGS